MNRTQAALTAAGIVAVLAAACIGRKDIVPPLAPAPAPTPAVKHQLYVFTEANCPYCVKLHAAMREPAAKEALAAFAVSEVDSAAKAWSWRVRAYPTLIVTDAAGKELGRHEGYLSAEALAAWLVGFQ